MGFNSGFKGLKRLASKMMFTIVHSKRYFGNTAGNVQCKVCVLVSATLQGIQMEQEHCSTLYSVYKRQGIVKCLSRLVAGLSPQRIRFSYKLGHVGFMVNRIAMAKISFPLPRPPQHLSTSSPYSTFVLLSLNLYTLSK